MRKEERLRRINYRRDCHKAYPEVNPDAYVSHRTLLDRIARGQSIVNPPREHSILPFDGDNLDDFETGTEEILDIVDAQRIQEETERVIEEAKEARRKKKEEEDKAELDKRVEDEIARRSAPSPAPDPDPA